MRNVQRGRLLVEGLGMQAHYWIGDLNVGDVDAVIARFIKAGVRIGMYHRIGHPRRHLFQPAHSPAHQG